MQQILKLFFTWFTWFKFKQFKSFKLIFILTSPWSNWYWTVVCKNAFLFSLNLFFIPLVLWLATLVYLSPFFWPLWPEIYKHRFVIKYTDYITTTTIIHHSKSCKNKQIMCMKIIQLIIGRFPLQTSETHHIHRMNRMTNNANNAMHSSTERAIEN